MTELSTIPISRLNNTELDTKIKTEIDKNGIDLSTIATNCITEISQDIRLELINWYCFEPVASAQYYFSKTSTIAVGSVLHYYIDEPNYDPNGEAKVISIEINSNGTFYTIEVIKEHYNFEVGYTFSNVRRRADEDRAYLVLKAGSTVYVPNGFKEDGTTLKFDEVVVSNDVTTSIDSNTQCLLCYNVSNPGIWWTTISNHGSGSTNPSDLYGFFYNTTDNKVYYLRNSSTPDNLVFSLPIAIVTSSGSQVTSVDQVFNGFGYIGSSVFTLPGVKSLIANGRNEDGTLKNIEKITTQVKIRNETPYSSLLAIFDGTELFSYGVPNYLEQDTIPTGFGTHAIWFNTRENKICQTTDGGSSWFFTYKLCLGELLKQPNENITKFSLKNTFHAADYNDVMLKSNIQFVSALPASPVSGVYYFVKE